MNHLSDAFGNILGRINTKIAADIEAKSTYRCIEILYDRIPYKESISEANT